MANSIRLIAPTGVTGINFGGFELTVPEDRVVEVPEQHVEVALSHGFMRPEVVLSQDAAVSIVDAAVKARVAELQKREVELVADNGRLLEQNVDLAAKLTTLTKQHADAVVAQGVAEAHARDLEAAAAAAAAKAADPVKSDAPKVEDDAKAKKK